MAPSGRKHQGTFIRNLPRRKRIYLGANQDQQIKIRSGTQSGVYFWNPTTRQRADLGAAHYMALALTECCAAYGHGKVFFYQTPENWQSKTGGSVRELPREMWYTPNLLYVDFEWNEHLRNEWFSLNHDERLDLLSVRAGALASGIPVLPIILCWERSSYETVAVWEGEGSVMLSFNDAGHMHIGFVDQITAAPGAKHFLFLDANHSTPSRASWMIPEASIANYRMRDGPYAVQTLHQMYQQQRPGSIILYRSIQEDSIKGHKIWARQGGYTIRGDKLLGPNIADEVAVVERANNELAAQPAAQPGVQPAAPTPVANMRLAELQAQTAEWDEQLQMFLQDFCAVALEDDALEMARFLSGNKDWQELDQDQQQLVIDIAELQAEDFHSRQLL